MRVRGFGHAGVTVRSMQRSLGFYADGLGLTCINRRVVTDAYIKRIVRVALIDEIEVAMLGVEDGPCIVELLEYRGREVHGLSSGPNDPGSGHLCLVVDDIDAVVRRAVGAGGAMVSARPERIASGPLEGGFSCYLRDPDGYIVELLQVG